MSSTSLQFGPEWMRNKQQTSASTTRPASLLSPTLTSTSPPAPGASSYSSLLTPVPPAPLEKQDSVNPFLYSKEELLQVWKDGGGRGGLGLEVELWEGVVRERGGEPIGLKEISEGEKKIFSGPLNSDLRRRQSHDFLPKLSPSTDRPKHSHPSSSTHSPLSQQRFGNLLARKRKDDGNDGGPSLSIPRRSSITSAASPLGGPLSPTASALPPPRNRLRSGSQGHDPLGSDGSWRKRDADSSRGGGILGDGHSLEERDEEAVADGDTSAFNPNGSFSDADASRSNRSMAPSPPSFRDDFGGRPGPADGLTTTLSSLALHDDGKKSSNASEVGNIVAGTHSSPVLQGGISAARPPGLENDPSNVSWSYMDPKGNIQGPFTATLMQKWYDEGYFTSDLLMKRTHLDTDWNPVGELSVRAGNEKLFFSSFSDSGPPGLARPSIPPIDGQTFDRTGQPLGQAPLQHAHHSPESYSNGSSLNHFRHPVANRTTTIDSFLASSSNQSHSPTSSFGAAGLAPMPTASPELPFAIPGGRASFGNTVTEPTFSGRGAFEQQSPSIAARSGNIGYGAAPESLYGPRLASLGQRGSMFEAQGFNPLNNPVAHVSPWSAGGSGNVPRNHDSDGPGSTAIHRGSLGNGGFTNTPVTNAPPFSELGGHDSNQFGSDAYNISNVGFSQPGRGDLSAEPLSSSFGPIGVVGLRDQSLRSLQELESATISAHHGIEDRSLTSPRFGIGFGSNATSTVPGQGIMFGVHGGQQSHPQQVVSQHLQQAPQTLAPISTFNQFPPAQAQAPASPGNLIQSSQLQHQQHVIVPTTQPLWGLPQPPPQSHPRPLDSPHPLSTNAMQAPVPASDISPYNDQQGQSEPSDWYKAEHAEDSRDISGAQPLPATQDTEAIQTQPKAWNTPPKLTSASVVHGAEQAPASNAPQSTLPPPPPPPPPQAQPQESVPHPSAKKRSTSQASQVVQVVAPKPSVAAPIIPPASAPKPPSPRPTTSTQPKPAWSTPVLSTDDETRATKQSGLREIQEAEAKRVEARKLAEREKERAARALPQEETPTFTASWGLPTSQAGAARSVPKDSTPAAATPTAVATPSPPVAPVWTNAAKPQTVKRTMKEIQEEEERRKKALAKEKETAAAAARRAYADSATKATPAPSTPTGGGWTTVGSSGKPSPAPTTPRQVTASGSSNVSPATSRVANGTPTRAQATPSQVTKASSSSRPLTADEGPVPPSPDFMKWLREAVRGFNAGFNTEEFMAMLLTFSLDFPPSTVEVIQDMVYMNSATLDGRRFAADFCARRKADAANRPKTAGGKQPSLADVVKTQPKSVQTELPFKMVKKKGRGNSLR